MSEHVHTTADPEQRCLVPLTEFCEWTPDTHQVGSGKPIKGEMWFEVTDQPLFAGFWQRTVSEQVFHVAQRQREPHVLQHHQPDHVG